MQSHGFDHCSKVRATFSPTKTHDLVPGLHQWTGWRGLWSYVGDANPDGEYAGQAGFSIAVEEQRKGLIFPAAWIPFCDLSNVEVIV